MIIRQLYTERRVTPLNLFLRDADEAAACEAVLDYGNAIKDLAAADIFTGDMLLKNFGVTRHGRVICYDYDELCLLSECSFRRLPQPTSIEEEFAAEPWFHVGEMDVFPEEFRAFLVPPGPAAGGVPRRRTAICSTWSSGRACSAGSPRARCSTCSPTAAPPGSGATATADPPEEPLGQLLQPLVPDSRASPRICRTSLASAGSPK